MLPLGVRGLVCVVVVGACAEGVPPERAAREVIGGFPATSASLNAIGALGWQEADGTRHVFCSGVLVGAKAVLTAEHCIDSLYPGDKFFVGPDVSHPLAAMEIEGGVTETSIEGGVGGRGSDIGIVHLVEAADGVTPFAVGTVSETEIGDAFVVAGYGYQSNALEMGTRRVGATTLRGLSGKHLQNLFATFDDFVADVAQAMYPEVIDEEIIALWWNDMELLRGYEASFGGGPGDAQDCNGDSGGPYLRMGPAGLSVVGLVTYGYGTPRLTCDWGGVAAIFGPVAKEFVARETACPFVPEGGQCQGLTSRQCVKSASGAWGLLVTDCALAGMICGFDDAGAIGCIDDPCAGIPKAGMCDGSVAVRCANGNEGPRRRLETDCGMLGLACGLDSDGNVSCI